MPNISVCRPPLILLAICFLAPMLAGCGRMGRPKPPEDFAPLPVNALAVEGNVDGVKIGWELPNVDEDKDEEEIVSLKGFRIMRSPYFRDEQDSKYELIKEITLDSPEQTAFTYTDRSPEPGKIYNYQVLPVNAEEALGEPGQTLRVTFLGENSRIEKIVEPSKRPDRATLKEQLEDQ